MGLELVGHTRDYKTWVFKIDGKTFVGTNFSYPNPLTIRFVGDYPGAYSGTDPLVDYKVLTLLSSTVQQFPQGPGGTVEWVYAGKRYRNGWLLTAGDMGESELAFDKPIPYDGPVGGPLAPPVGQTPPPVGSPSSVSYPGPSGTGTTPPVVQTPPVTRPKFTEVTYTPYAGPSGAQGASAEKKPNLVPVVLGIAYLLLQ